MAKYREILKNSVDELLPPCESIQFLEERKIILINLKKKLQKDQSRLPQTHLRIGKSHGSVQYFEILNKSDKKGIYIPKEQIARVYKLAQSQYNAKVIKLLDRQIKVLDVFIRNFSTDAVVKLYETLPFSRKNLLSPVTMTDCEFAQKWLAISYERLPFRPGDSELFTSSGDRVRSKSEILIAEALTRRGIPYRYEYPIKLQNNGRDIKVHPDFCCLNLRTRKEIFWEHFGLMDNLEYEQGAVAKLNTYTQNKIFLGKNLIATFETVRQPLSSKTINLLINEYF